MASTLDPRGGIYYGWDLGESGWQPQMDANLKRISRVALHLSVLDRNLSAPPGSPANGDAYIVGASATGAWAGYDDYLAVWDGPVSAWALYQPRIGWIAYIEDEQVLSAYKVAGWSAGIAI